MANLETERKITPAPQQDRANPSASIALNEENLEALLNALNGAGMPALAPRQQTPPPSAVEPPAPVAMPAAPIAEPPAKTNPAAETKMEAEAPPDVSASLVQARKDAEPLPAAAPASPAAAPQQDVFSKLALISSIKQRRAVTTRPESSNPAAELASAPAAPPTPAGATRNSEQPREAAPQASTSTALPATPPATLPATQASPEKPALPAKKVWSSGTSAPRREEALGREDEPGREEARPREELRSAKRAAVPSTPMSTPNEMFAALEAAKADAAADKTKSFVTSKAGMGAIGGAVLAAALAAFFLMGHGTKNAAKPTATQSAQPPSPGSATPIVAAVSDKPSEEPLSADKPPAATAQTTPQATAPRTEANAGAKQQTAPAAKPGVAQTPAAPPIANSQPPAVAESPRTVARTFAPPTPTAGPVSSAILEAPPALATTTTAPAAVALPSRIAPLPPPPAPRTAPATTVTAAAPNGTQPRQVVITGQAQATKLARQVLPVYPALARTARVQGTVRFRVTVGVDGQVKALTTLGGPLPLVSAASDAVKQWRYQPTIVDGQAVEVITEVDVAFAL